MGATQHERHRIGSGIKVTAAEGRILELRMLRRGIADGDEPVSVPVIPVAITSPQGV